jgi:ATP-dependent RNA helicase DHX36
VYVVDSGRVKESRRDEIRETPALVETWVSQASAKQRRGRAGRLRSGVAYHMYSSHTYQTEMQSYQVPEMLRVGLEDLVLQILILDLGDPHAFLSRAMNPPTARAVRNSLDLLEQLGAVENKWSDELADSNQLSESEKSGECGCEHLSVRTELTALGFHLATLPVEPRIGKMMIYGSLFGCIGPALTMAASMSSRSPFVAPFNQRDASDKAREQFCQKDENSDHLVVVNAFDEWLSIRLKRGDRAAHSFAHKNFLSSFSLAQFQCRQYRARQGSFMCRIVPKHCGSS